MRKEKIAMFGCLVLVGMLVGGMLLCQPVGSPVSQFEVGKIVGGTCYVEDANAPKGAVCAVNNGSLCDAVRQVNPRTVYSSGKSPAGIPCGTYTGCTYGGVGGDNCAAG